VSVGCTAVVSLGDLADLAFEGDSKDEQHEADHSEERDGRLDDAMDEPVAKRG